MVFVAGGTSSVDLGIAGAIAATGAKFAVVSRSLERLNKTEQRPRTFGSAVLGFSADVRDAKVISETLKSTHDALGLIDVLIAGGARNFLSPALGIVWPGQKSVPQAV